MKRIKHITVFLLTVILCLCAVCGTAFAAIDKDGKSEENPFEEIFYSENKYSGSLFDELV